MARKIIKTPAPPPPTPAQLRENATWGLKQVQMDIDHKVKKGEEALAKFKENIDKDANYAFDWADDAREYASTQRFWYEAKVLLDKYGLDGLLTHYMDNLDRYMGYSQPTSGDNREIARRYVGKVALEFIKTLKGSIAYRDKLLLKADGLELGL